ncbi:hypothetical protein JABBAWOKKIE_55 [Mycobacterium phage Jabbawokkie]|nr:hypothetical protein N850_gp053 [Mycobacterium phage Jabbawokkie]AGT12154.1 hypothetical protein JABBAWOKKIE_55 [Mycobacterium phage Jabbawokkie]
MTLTADGQATSRAGTTQWSGPLRSPPALNIGLKFRQDKDVVKSD